MARKPKSKEKTIPNWTMFGCLAYNIEIHFLDYDENDDPVYGAALSFFLDAGSGDESDSDPNFEQHITIHTDFIGPDPMALAWIMLHSFDPEMFGERLCSIWLIDEDNECNELNVQDILNTAEETHEDNQLVIHCEDSI